MEIHLKKQSLSVGFTTSGEARQLKSFCNLIQRENFILCLSVLFCHHDMPGRLFFELFHIQGQLGPV